MSGSSRTPEQITKDASDINDTLADFQSFPILTRDIGQTTGPRPASGGQAAYGQVVHAALQEVLGWRPRPGDAKGLTAALNQSFHAKEVQGHTEWTWTPRTYSIEVDLGAVTGAQASIYARAKFALDHSLPLLEGLTPLRADPDSQDMDAMQAIVRSELMELVYELGLEGGPRLFRVDELFGLLLGEEKQLQDPERVGGQLGLLRDRFGLQRQRVNTIDEEQNLTNFLILVDNVNSLRQTWESQRHFFDRTGSDVFFGTQMVQLSRALAVVSESIQENNDVLDSVFLGDAERQVTELKLLPDTTLYLGELLSRVKGFAMDEGPHLIREGGKDGLIHAFRPTAARLRDLVQAAAKLSGQGSQNPTRGFHTARVQRSLSETAAHLDTVVRLSAQVNRLPGPFPTRVIPSVVNPLPQITLIIEGARFQQGLKVSAVHSSADLDIIVHGFNVDVVSESIIQATFDLSGKPQGTSWNVIVTNQEGIASELPNAFSIVPPTTRPAPVLGSIEPASGEAGSSGSVVINGQNFHLDATSDFGEGIDVLFTAFESGQKLIAIINIDASAEPGPRAVTVTNPDAQKSASEVIFTVSPKPVPAPTIIDFNPAEGNPEDTLEVIIDGEDFQPEATVNFGDGITINSVDFDSAERLTVSITIDADATEGGRVVTVTNPGGLDDSMKSFRVLITPLPPPEIGNIRPARGNQGANVPVTLTGEGFQPDAEVRIGDENSGIQVDVTGATPTRLTALINIVDAATGKYDVTVINPDGQTDKLPEGFEVRAGGRPNIEKAGGPQEPASN